MASSGRYNPYRSGASKPPKRHNPYFYLWLIPVFALGIVLLYIGQRSWRPHMRLIPDPPAEFLATNPRLDAKRLQAEQQLGRAYWDCAVNVVQYRYFYGTSLPQNPPEIFRINPRALPNPKVATPESRDYYWRRLCMVWPVPGVWEEEYGWDTTWITDLIERWAGKFPRIIGTLVF